MTFSYDGSLTTDINKVRFLIQDTVESTHELTDEELQYLLDTHVNVNDSAVAAARILYGKYARQVDKAVGDLRISFSQKAKHWELMVDYLEEQSAASVPTEFYIGGLSEAEQDTDDEDTDLVQPSFKIGMHSRLSDYDLDSLRADI